MQSYSIIIHTDTDCQISQTICTVCTTGEVLMRSLCIFFPAFLKGPYKLSHPTYRYSISYFLPQDCHPFPAHKISSILHPVSIDSHPTNVCWTLAFVRLFLLLNVSENRPGIVSSPPAFIAGVQNRTSGITTRTTLTCYSASSWHNTTGAFTLSHPYLENLLFFISNVFFFFSDTLWSSSNECSENYSAPVSLFIHWAQGRASQGIRATSKCLNSARQRVSKLICIADKGCFLKHQTVMWS